MQRIIRRDAASGQGTQAGGQLRYEGLSARMCALLRARGITTEAEARAYLHPSLDQRHDPMLLHDMDKALGILAVFPNVSNDVRDAHDAPFERARPQARAASFLDIAALEQGIELVERVARRS